MIELRLMHGKQFMATDFNSIGFHVIEKSLHNNKHLTKSVRNNPDNVVIVCHVSISFEVIPLNEIQWMHIALCMHIVFKEIVHPNNLKLCLYKMSIFMNSCLRIYHFFANFLRWTEFGLEKVRILDCLTEGFELDVFFFFKSHIACFSGR